MDEPTTSHSGATRRADTTVRNTLVGDDSCQTLEHVRSGLAYVEAALSGRSPHRTDTDPSFVVGMIMHLRLLDAALAFELERLRQPAPTMKPDASGREAFLCGKFSAFGEGESRNCPFPVGSVERRAWLAGRTEGDALWRKQKAAYQE